MKNVNRLFTFFLLMFSFAFYGVTQAGIITVGKITYDPDYDSGVLDGSGGKLPGSTLVDKLNSREWLRWDVLMDQISSNYNFLTNKPELSLESILGPEYDDYFIATQSDAQMFLNALAFPGPSGCKLTLTNVIGTECQTVIAGFFGDSYNSDFDAVYYLSDDGVDEDLGLLLFHPDLYLRAYDESASLDKVGKNDIGLFLYKNVVSEPSILALLSIGLLGMGLARRRVVDNINREKKTQSLCP